jgi:hypothetical protein
VRGCSFDENGFKKAKNAVFLPKNRPKNRGCVYWLITQSKWEVVDDVLVMGDFDRESCLFEGEGVGCVFGVILLQVKGKKFVKCEIDARKKPNSKLGNDAIKGRQRPSRGVSAVVSMQRLCAGRG